MENKNNKSLKTKLSNAFNGAKETLKNTTEAIKQGAEKIGTKAKQAGAGILLGTALLTGCAQINNPYIEDILNEETIESTYEQEQQFNEINAPYTETINGFKFHNFFGQQPDIKYETMHEDVYKYLTIGAEYLTQELNNFEKSLDGRLQAEYYFNHPEYHWGDKFLSRARTELETATPNIDGDKDFIPLIDALAVAGITPLMDIADNLQDNNERVYFGSLFKLLSISAKYNAMEHVLSKNTTLQEKLQTEIQSTIDYANKHITKKDALNKFVTETESGKVINLEDTTTEVNSILERIAHKINPETTANDFQFVMNYELNGSSLIGMHDYLVEVGYHKGNCYKTHMSATAADPADAFNEMIYSNYLKHAEQNKETEQTPQSSGIKTERDRERNR